MMIISTLILLLATGFLSEGQYSPIYKNSLFDIEDAPWHVSVQVQGQHMCSGTIFSQSIIITAARCFNMYVPIFRPLRVEEILIVAGSELRFSRKYLAAAFSTRCPDPIVNIEDTLCIIILWKPLPNNIYIKPIPLAKDSPPPGSEVIATGWGPNNNNLQALKLVTRSYEICKNVTGYTPHHICIESLMPSGDPSECIGDTGGPLVYNDTLVGVIAMANACSGPVGYSSMVSHYNSLKALIGNSTGVADITQIRAGKT